MITRLLPCRFAAMAAAVVQRFGATVDGEERFFDASSVMHFSDGRQKERWFHIHDLSAFDEFIARF